MTVSSMKRLPEGTAMLSSHSLLYDFMQAFPVLGGGAAGDLRLSKTCDLGEQCCGLQVEPPMPVSEVSIVLCRLPYMEYRALRSS